MRTVKLKKTRTFVVAKISCNKIRSIQLSSLRIISFYFIFLNFIFPQTEAHLDTLISEQASFILARSGVGSLYTVYQENRGQMVRKFLALKSPLVFVYAVIPLSFESNDARYFRIKESFLWQLSEGCGKYP